MSTTHDGKNCIEFGRTRHRFGRMTTPTRIELPANAAQDIRAIVRAIVESGHECYLVGGSVRDLILGRPVYDFDFATDAHPTVVTKLFRRTVPTGIKHGTVTVLIRDRAYEVTTYRADGTYLDGRRPESVTFSKTLREDVARRDFTINGLAYDVLREEIIDYVEGLEDLARRSIRTIGDPLARFTEDGLRPFRACRFAAALEFGIEPETLDAIPQTLEVARLVAVERVRDELMKMLAAPRPSVGLEYLRVSGLMDLVLPELARCHGVSQNKYHVYDVYYHSLYSCDAAPAERPVIRLAALLHDLGKIPTRRAGDDGEATFYNHEVVGTRMAKAVMKRLKFPAEDIQKVANLVNNHMFHYTDEWTDGAVRRFMRKVDLENLEDLFALRLADRRGNGQRDGLPAPIRELMRRIDTVIEEENAIKVTDLDINGHVIMQEFGVAPGPIIGKILNELLELVLDDPALNARDVLVERARGIFARLREES